MIDLKESGSQTAGPYVHIGCTPNIVGLTGQYGGQDLGHDMIQPGTTGERITVYGTLLDGAGDPVRDGMVEVWQANANGQFDDPDFQGWGRCACDLETGRFQFDTIKPGAVAWDDGPLQAPHLTLWIVARGINLGLHTRLYFADEDNSQDPVLTLVPSNRQATLIAAKSERGYHLDIHLQGPQETVFFDV